MTAVEGRTESGFEAVRDVLERQFEAGDHIGAAVAVNHRGRLVVDIWGGIADQATGKPWGQDTMAVSYSTTKGLAATCVHVLADRGLIDYDAPVARYWPEFAANGKERITVYHVLTHQAGVPQLPDGITTDDMLDWDRMVRGIADLAPAWEPGTDSGYHALNFGWLAGELVRRVDGRSIGRFFHEEIAAPLGLTSIFIGTPPDAEPKIAPLVMKVTLTPEMAKQREASRGTLTARSMSPASGDMNELLNSRAGHAAEIPAVNGVMTARDLARFYACLANYGELDGVRILSEATVRRMSERQTYRPDRVIIVPVGWALGYMTGGAEGWPQGPRTTSFGHIGFGGSVGFADPEIGMSFALVLNALALDLIGAGRTAALATAARACAEALRSD